MGFAAETHDLEGAAADRLAREGLDLIVANDAGSSIGQPDSAAVLLAADGPRLALPRQPKAAAAATLGFALERWPTRLGRVAPEG